MMSLFSRRKKSTTSIGSFYSSIYPESIRYALAHKGAKMGTSEIRALLDRYTYEAMYLVIKAYAGQVEEQRSYFEGLTLLFSDPDFKLDDLRAFLSDRIDGLSADTQVNGAKLAQLNRSGSDQWQKAFEDIATDLYENHPRSLPCLVAYTSVLGFHQFVKVYSQKRNARISIVVPEWMIDADYPNMGYEIALGKQPAVTIQPKSECLVGSWACMGSQCKFHHRFCGGAVFIDDTINTGETSGKLRGFWKSEYGLKIPPERVRVITDLRGSPLAGNKKKQYDEAV